MTSDPVRLWGAAAMLLAWLLLCAAIVLRRRLSQRAATRPVQWIVAYASQTGSAEQLAQQTVATLKTAGLSALACSLSELEPAQLRQSERILFIVSTYGEGDPPDNALRFVRTEMKGVPKLDHLHYAVLALGDSSYAEYCGFGRALDQWLGACGATPLFERIEVDRGAAPAITAWQEHLCHLAGALDAPDWSEPAYADWRIVERTHINAGSAGEAVYRIALAPADGVFPQWEAGDLAQVSVPGEPGLPREYSIASLPAEGRLELLVRLHRRADGAHGLASGFLCLHAPMAEPVALRVREHRRFRIGDNLWRPLILIGNGTGMAGLRAHFKERDFRSVDCWLVFGERNEASDFHYREDVEASRAMATLVRFDGVFSRDQEARRYVQHVLRESGAALRDWVDRGAAIYVCGGLLTMAAGVHEVLEAELGKARLEQLADEGRYRRDVY
ncbi:MAG: sulfite reductase subunit alpha [Pseudomonadota bacterium]